ncbi:PTS sugar transporter subunit IIA [Lentibacillus sp.]|uniref:PTS sugar transporter subunit IIA n=1 Tax=Lentibacillus sp. TaxID=1925746 RepID=UPI002B4B51A4|nr:PTS sugar transporter subunit IIA [Lentibacillus sp.]HLS08196.1 PTS sugar transporter subunit IIA [Lentibacillus sp.]
MIENLLKESTVQLQVDASNWEEAGIKAGNLLLENNYIKEDYINRMLEAVYEYGPYIVIAPGMALFHARPENSVNNICMSMITLKEPVEFGAGDKDPVNLVFALGAIDHDSHLKAMAELMTILQDDQLVADIKNEKDSAKVLEMIYQTLD